jgi:hypothetical protein
MPDPVEYHEEWRCVTCEPDTFRTPYDRFGLVAHVRTVHGGDPVGDKSMVVHLDFAREYRSTYRWTFRTPTPVEVLQYVTGPRRGRR